MPVACVGLARSSNAMPPMGIIKVSTLSFLWEIRSGGAKDAAYRAFLSSLDKRAEILPGADVWRNNAWKGYAPYSSPGGGLNIVFFEKDCGQKASDKAGKQSRVPWVEAAVAAAAAVVAVPEAAPCDRR